MALSGRERSPLTLRAAENSHSALARFSPLQLRNYARLCRGGTGGAMTIMPHSLLVAAHPSRRWVTFARHTVSVLSVFADVLAILGIAVLMGSLYHLVFYGHTGPIT